MPPTLGFFRFYSRHHVRLADSVPVNVIKSWKKELEAIEDNELRESELNRRIAKYEDAGHGKLLLKIPECAEIVQAKLS